MLWVSFIVIHRQKTVNQTRVLSAPRGSRRDRVACGVSSLVSSGRGTGSRRVDVERASTDEVSAPSLERCALRRRWRRLSAIICPGGARTSRGMSRGRPRGIVERHVPPADHLAPWSQLGGPVRSYVADCRLCEAASRVPRHGPRHEHEPNVRSPLSANGHPRSHASALSAARRARIIPPRIAPRASSGRAALSE